MMIALGAAKGLAFLHNAERPVIYRDFKTSNILLDSVCFLNLEINSCNLVLFILLNWEGRSRFPGLATGGDAFFWFPCLMNRNSYVSIISSCIKQSIDHSPLCVYVFMYACICKGSWNKAELSILPTDEIPTTKSLPFQGFFSLILFELCVHFWENLDG